LLSAWFVALACRTTPSVPEELLATLTACPYGVEHEVVSTYTPECVKEIFKGEIRLVDPGKEYSRPSFTILTPAEPSQLQAVYGALNKNESEAIRLNIDPPEVLPLFTPTEEVRVGGLVVEIAKAEEGRTQFYWQQDGWRYTLDASVMDSTERDFVLAMIARAE
jgi:hypothetical protein